MRKATVAAPAVKVAEGLVTRAAARIRLVATALAAAAVVALSAPAAALACDTSYWNISCQVVYTPGSGATVAATQTSQPVTEDYTPYPNDFRVIWTTSGGTWKQSVLDTNGSNQQEIDFFPVSVPSGEKVGCFNPTYNGNLLVNCRRGAL